METAKVDVRRLHVLNDRINQTLEALNQVRISIHALQYVPDERIPLHAFSQQPLGYGYSVPFATPGFNNFNNYPLPYATPYGTPYATPYGTSYATPYGTSSAQIGFGSYPWQPQSWATPWTRPVTQMNGHDDSQARFVDARFATPFGTPPMAVSAFG